jgi:isopentenyl phosphate kinase
MKYLIKFGGSAITNKGIPNYPITSNQIIENPDKYIKLDVLEKIAGIVKSVTSKDDDIELVLITGAGCCGHPQVKANFPYDTISKIACLPALYLGKILFDNKIPSNLVSPIVCAKCTESDGQHGTEYDVTELWRRLQNPDSDFLKISGYARITHGDVVPMAAGKTGRLGTHEVLGGDDLVAYFAEMWQADKVITVSNIEGVYKQFPPNSGEKPIGKIVANEKIRDDLHFKEKMESEYGVTFKDVGDVTKGLLGKARKLYDLTYKTGISSQICSLDDLEAVLQGEKRGTLIEKA